MTIKMSTCVENLRCHFIFKYDFMFVTTITYLVGYVCEKRDSFLVFIYFYLMYLIPCVWKTSCPIKRAYVKIILEVKALIACACVYACEPLHSSVLFLHIFHSITSLDCTGMKLHVAVLMPLHVMHI